MVRANISTWHSLKGSNKDWVCHQKQKVIFISGSAFIVYFTCKNNKCTARCQMPDAINNPQSLPRIVLPISTPIFITRLFLPFILYTPIYTYLFPSLHFHLLNSTPYFHPFHTTPLFLPFYFYPLISTHYFYHIDFFSPLYGHLQIFTLLFSPSDFTLKFHPLICFLDFTHSLSLFLTQIS